MKTENAVLMAQARTALAGKWGMTVGAMFVYTLIVMVLGFVPFLPFIIAGPFTLGLTIFSLAIARSGNPHIEQIFEGFKRFGVSLVAWLLMMLYVLLWALLLIIPGIVASFAYAMTFYVIADDPTISATDALRKSKVMMTGNKWKLFCLTLRFFGWMILAMLTFGIGFLWLMPYMQVTFAKFYDEVKGGLSQ